MKADTLIFDKWANEPSVRIEAWRLVNGDVRIIFREDTTRVLLATATLTDYRADDLCQALLPGTPRPTLASVRENITAFTTRVEQHALRDAIHDMWKDKP